MIHLGLDGGRFAIKTIGQNGYTDTFPTEIGPGRPFIPFEVIAA